MDSELRRRISHNNVLTHSEIAKIINDLETLEQLRSKIDKTIEEMNGYARFHRDKIHNDVERGKYLAYKKSLEILKRNIGE